MYQSLLCGDDWAFFSFLFPASAWERPPSTFLLTIIALVVFEKQLDILSRLLIMRKKVLGETQTEVLTSLSTSEVNSFDLSHFCKCNRIRVVLQLSKDNALCLDLALRQAQGTSYRI